VSISRLKWEWFGYPGHFICANDCRFRLCTKVGKFLISTVGDLHYSHDSGERRTLGAGKDSFFETYVFKAGPRCSDEACGCKQPTIDGSEIDGERCATAGEAQTLHIKYCEKYSQSAKGVE
jgi:hypothetical protein